MNKIYRVEIINPGTFPSNITMAELRAGNKSEPRNPTIARVMYSRKTVETWGRGIKLILDECAKANLPEPQILAGGGYTRTVFMRPGADSEGGMKGGMKTNYTDLDQKDDLDRGLDDLERRIVEFIRVERNSTYATLAKKCDCSIPTIQRKISALQKKSIVRRVGPDRGGHWEVIEG